MRVGYFSHTKLDVSETFIYDLVKDLNSENSIDLTYFSGKESGEIKVDFDLKYIFTGFDSTFNFIDKVRYYFYRILSTKSAGEYKIYVQKKRAFIALSKSADYKLDCAFVDYANSAILLREFFNKNNIPFILHVHGYDITSSLNLPGYEQELKEVLKEAKYIIAASHYMKRLLVLLGADELKIKVIRIGIDVKSIEPLKWELRKSYNPNVIFLGRLAPKKHPIALLHAFKLVLDEIPNAFLTIIGDGPLRKEVEKRVNMLGISESVSLLGSLSREKSFPIMNEHWVYAQHSVTASDGDQEGYALSPAEAAAHEIPVVSTIHNGIPEHVIDGVTGYLVPEFNYEAMAERIIYLLKNPDICEKLGKRGRENILKMNDGVLRTKTIKKLLEEIKK